MDGRTPGEIDKRLGEVIRRVRLARGLTQEDLARKLGITFQQIQKYERGINRIAVVRFWELAALLEVSPAALMDAATAPNAPQAESPLP